MSRPLPPGTILPQGVVCTGPGRYEHNHRSSQVYFGLVFGIAGIVAPSIIIANMVNRGNASAGSIAPVFLFPIIFVGVCVYFCYRFKWSKMVIDFSQRRVNYVTASFPFILCQQPSQSCSIDALANLHVHDSGWRNGGRRGHGGEPILIVQALIDGSAENVITLQTVNGHYNASAVISQWSNFLQAMGITVTNPAMAQLQAIMPMTGIPIVMAGGGGGSPMMMQQQPLLYQQQSGSPMNQSPPYGMQPTPGGMYPGTNMTATYPGTNMTPASSSPTMSGGGYGLPPPPPPPPAPIGGAPMPGFATFENTASPNAAYNYAAPPPIQH